MGGAFVGGGLSPTMVDQEEGDFCQGAYVLHRFTSTNSTNTLLSSTASFLYRIPAVLRGT